MSILMFISMSILMSIPISASTSTPMSTPTYVHPHLYHNVLPQEAHLGIEDVENVLHHRRNRLPFPQFRAEALVHRDDVVNLAEHGGDELGAACFVREDVGALRQRVGEQLRSVAGNTTAHSR